MISRQARAGWAVAAALIGTLSGCTCEAPEKPAKAGGETATAGGGAEEREGAVSDTEEALKGAPDADPGAMTSPRMQKVARGEERLGTLVDRSKGLVVVERYEDPSGEDGRLQDGWVSVARRLCGEPLEVELARLEKDLGWRAKAAEEDGEELFQCGVESCSHAGLGEYDVQGTYHFTASGSRLVLDQVWRLETALISEEATAKNERYIQGELKRLAGGTCAGGASVNAGFYRVCNTAADRQPGLPLREEASWDRELPSILGNEAMLDGQLVEDLGRREGDWWWVRVVKGEARHEGWVQARNREPGSPGAGHPTLCPAR